VAISDPRESGPVAPEFFVSNVGAAIDFYTNRLAFKVLRLEPEGEPGPHTIFAIVALGDAHVLLAHESLYAGGPLSERGAGVDIRIMVPDVDVVYARCRENSVKIVHDIADRYYGLRDFIIADPNGFRLRFAAPLR